MNKTQNLIWRSGRAYFRRRVPQDLIDLFGKKEKLKALNTSDKAEARKLAIFENAAFEAELAVLREQKKCAENTPDQLSLYNDEQISGVALRWLRSQERNALQRELKETEALTQDEWYQSCVESEIDLQEIKDSIRLKDTGPGMTIAGNWLDEQGITYDTKSEMFRKLGLYFNQAILQRATDEVRKIRGFQVVPTSATPSTQVEIGEQTAGKKVSIEELFEKYLSDPSRNRNFKTHNNYKFTLQVLKEILGAKTYLNEITRDDCRTVRDFLITMPSNATKKYPGLSLKQASKKAKIDGNPTLSPKSINKYLMQLSTVIKYAVRERYLTINVAEGLSVHDPVSNIAKRPSFTSDDLKVIFSAPLYTGSIDDERHFNKPGPNIIRRARFWLPLIGAFTGMRLNEICQLEVDDIRHIDDVPVFDVRLEGKHGKKAIKNKGSIRIIPVHPELQKIGFLDYVQGIRDQGHVSIFPELKTKAGSYKSDGMSQKVNRFFKSLGFKESKPSKDFHSFRGAVATSLNRAEVSGSAIDNICGWAPTGTRKKHYQEPLNAKERYESICKLSYKGLDLSHLYKN